MTVYSREEIRALATKDSIDAVGAINPEKVVTRLGGLPYLIIKLEQRADADEISTSKQYSAVAKSLNEAGLHVRVMPITVAGDLISHGPERGLCEPFQKTSLVVARDPETFSKIQTKSAQLMQYKGISPGHWPNDTTAYPDELRSTTLEAARAAIGRGIRAGFRVLKPT